MIHIMVETRVRGYKYTLAITSTNIASFVGIEDDGYNIVQIVNREDATIVQHNMNPMV